MDMWSLYQQLCHPFLYQLKFPNPLQGQPQDRYGELFMLASGTGLAPMLPIIQYITGNEDDETFVTLVGCFKTFENIYMKSLLQEQARFWNIRTFYVLSQERSLENLPWSFQGNTHIGRINENMIRSMMDTCRKQPFVLICGSVTFSEDMERHLKAIGLGEESYFCKMRMGEIRGTTQLLCVMAGRSEWWPLVTDAEERVNLHPMASTTLSKSRMSSVCTFAENCQGNARSRACTMVTHEAPKQPVLAVSFQHIILQGSALGDPMKATLWPPGTIALSFSDSLKPPTTLSCIQDESCPTRTGSTGISATTYASLQFLPGLIPFRDSQEVDWIGILLDLEHLLLSCGHCSSFSVVCEFDQQTVHPFFHVVNEKIKQDRPQDRALGDPACHWLPSRWFPANGYLLLSVSQPCPNPPDSALVYPITPQFLQQDIMGHFVKGLAEIQVYHIHCILSI
ncbi:NADH-cytochrome b5 reductase-like [Varanus komodoensis]|nr:NADH-cytochrome b5 reductase-like [Varanus komodoensis]